MTTIVLLAAGLGTRMGKYSSMTNKTLLPVNGKAIISHIIEQFDPSMKFVVAVGYKANLVKSYLAAAHPEINFTFVNIENFHSSTAGPGTSLIQCTDHIPSDFIVIACDALYEDISSLICGRNTLGVSKIDPIESTSYCNVEVVDDKIVGVKDKVHSDTGMAFNGAFYIKDYIQFWNNLDGPELSSGFSQLEMYAKESKWVDLGSICKYKQYTQSSHGFDFSKDDEFIYFVGDRVIKWFADERISINRIAKASMNPKLFPAVSYAGAGFYFYEKIKGETLYSVINDSLFEKFINWCHNNIWNKSAQLDVNDIVAFYSEKTNDRLFKFTEKNSNFNPVSINSIRVFDSFSALFQKYVSGISEILYNDLEIRGVFMHGDLQLANVIYDESGGFRLIDWRQDFAGKVESGDLYYDIAKIKASLIIDYDKICKGEFDYLEKDGHVEFSLPDNNRFKNMIGFIEQKYPKDIIDALVTIIFLNMAALHREPFDKLLYCLALERIIKSENNRHEKTD